MIGTTLMIDKSSTPDVYSMLEAELNDTVDKACKKYGVKFSGSAHFGLQGNYTVCYLLPSRGKAPVSFGVAKRNPNTDDYDIYIGCHVALGRALKALGEKQNQFKLAA